MCAWRLFRGPCFYEKFPAGVERVSLVPTLTQHSHVWFDDGRVMHDVPHFECAGAVVLPQEVDDV